MNRSDPGSLGADVSGFGAGVGGVGVVGVARRGVVGVGVVGVGGLVGAGEAPPKAYSSAPMSGLVPQ